MLPPIRQTHESPRSPPPSSPALTVVERQERQMRSFLRNFLAPDDESGGAFRRVIDLRQHALDTGLEVSDATLQEVVATVPLVRGLNLTGCTQVTDAGLWALARAGQGRLDTLLMAGCTRVTALGLRLVAHNCPLVALDLSDCPQVTDSVLQTIAAGCWMLESFELRRCPNVSDAGIVKLAQCCKELRRLDLAHCARLGEYGDKALLELGRCCPALEVLDLFGCQHVQDAGVRAVARGCTKLSTLRLSGCRQVSSAAIQALATSCPDLEMLSLAGCGQTTNADVARLARCCPRLRWLDISGSPNIDAAGVRELARHAKRLEYLSLACCPRVGDTALVELASCPTAASAVLAQLSLANCPAVSERGVEALAAGCPALLTLDLTGCAQIGRRFLQRLIAKLVFVEWSSTFYGFEPLPNAAELARQREFERYRARCAVKIQAAMRGCLSRGGLWQAKLKYVERRILPLMQARARGFLVRKRFAHEAQYRREDRAARVIGQAYRDLRLRRKLARAKRLRRIKEHEEEAAIIFQKVFRGHRDRQRVSRMRDALFRQQQFEARVAAMRGIAATKLQRAYRGHHDRREASMLRAARSAHQQQMEREARAAAYLQRVYRGHQGRKQRAERLRELVLAQRRQQGAVALQRVVRGHRGRRRATQMRQEAQANREIEAASTIQRYWRGLQDKHLAAVLLGLVKLRAREQAAAFVIQAAYRLHAARGFARTLRLALQAQKKRVEAVTVIQRLARGHRARALADVERELQRFQAQARPLFDKAARLEDAVATQGDAVNALRAKLAAAEEDEKALSLELDKTLRIKTKFHDSSRITGTPQRYLTQYLQVQLADQLRAKRVEIALDSRTLDVLENEWNDTQAKLRVVLRELEPLTNGVIAKTREARTKRLQDQVRRERAGATTIQRLFRGFRVRCAVSEGTNCWIQLWTTASSTNGSDPSHPYYYNTLTGETRWHKPLAMDIFGDQFMQPMTATGAPSTSSTSSRPPAVDETRAVVHELDVHWYEGYDDAVQAAYYYNTQTKEYQWDRPESISNAFLTDTATSRRRRAWLDEQQLSENGGIEQLLSVTETSGAMIGQWEKRVEPLSEHFFFFHPPTGQAQASLSPRTVHISLTESSATSSARSHRRSARSVGSNGSARPLHWQYRYGYEYDTDGQLVASSRSARRPIWTEHTDESSGLPYYFNALTNEYRWEKPADFDVDYETFASGRSASSQARQWFDSNVQTPTGDAHNSSRSSGRLTTRSVKSRVLGKKWVEYVDMDSGHSYYYNELTGETRWSLSPRSARDTSDNDDQISLALFEQVTRLRDVPVVYAGREEHMAWLETALADKNWTKVDVLVQQIQIREQSYQVASARASAEQSISQYYAEVKTSGNGDHWIEYTDESNGGVYYYNEVTGETSWSRPEDTTAMDTSAVDNSTWSDLSYEIDA